MNSGEPVDSGKNADTQAPSLPAQEDNPGIGEPVSLVNTRICDLGLTIENSAVEKFVQQLYRELEQKRIMKFRPACFFNLFKLFSPLTIWA